MNMRRLWGKRHKLGNRGMLLPDSFSPLPVLPAASFQEKWLHLDGVVRPEQGRCMVLAGWFTSVRQVVLGKGIP